MKSPHDNDLKLTYAGLERELAKKNRELEIEAALDRVRSVAMGMRTPDDLLDICRAMYKELQTLGFAEMRNAMINILHDEQGFFLDYDFNDTAGATVTKFMYDSSPMMKQQVEITRSSSDAFIEHILTGADLEEFKAFRIQNGEEPDPMLENIPALHYYFYSIGIGSVGISVFGSLSEQKREVLKRFRNIFDLAYRRYADIELAGAQAKESRLETALERVRSRSMGMQKSDELKEVIQLIYRQFVHLNINIDHTGFVVDYKAGGDWHFWVADQLGSPANLTVADYDCEWNNRFDEAKEKGIDFFATNLNFDEKNKFYRDLFDHAPGIPEQEKELIFNKPGLAISTVLLADVALYIENYAGTLYTDEENATLMRFGKVFQQTYTRFLDLQKAETQAREAQIEVSLERVRARTMAMQKSEELAIVIQSIYDQLVCLGLDVITAGFIMDYKKKADMDIWVANQGQPDAYKVNIPYYDGPIYNLLYEAIEKGIDFYPVVLNKEEKDIHYRHVFQHTSPVPNEVKEMIYSMPGYADSHVLLKDVVLFISNLAGIPYSDEENTILMRFGKVFEQTYIRFSDLKKAEEQARESQIQLALERIRARTMAMQHSDELAETVFILFQQFKDLGENPDQATIGIVNEEEHVIEYWVTIHGEQTNRVFKFSIDEPNVTHKIYKGWKEHKKSLVIDLSGKALHDFTTYRESMGGAPAKKGENRRIINVAFFSKGLINVQSNEERSEGSLKLLERFAGVFEGTYTRFLDLKQAEAQTNEARIEAALERIRSKTMAMHNSKDVAETVAAMFDECVKLGVESKVRCGVGIIAETKHMEVLTAYSNTDGKVGLVIGGLDMTSHQMLQGVFDSWKKKEVHSSYMLSGKDQKNYYRAVNHSAEYDAHFKISDLPAKQFQNAFYFREGFIYVFSPEQLSVHAVQIFTRFAGVFGQTYRRYLDLLNAEAQAREAIKQASLDRVRGEIASMRTTNDLERITPLIWNELMVLGIPFIRCGVFIVDEEEEVFHTHLSTPDGKALATFNLPFDSEGIGQIVLPAWRNKQIATNHWNAEEFTAYTNNLVDQGAVTSQERYVTEHPDTSLDLHFFPFLQGMLYVGNISTLSVEEMSLVQSLADSFSTAYARYEDFTKLEAAKLQVENTLTYLKAAQTKLIQSEKMASLGELTAGIAHEIQNPLNFVNNFSEVNQEMIDELEEELRAGNIEDALAIAADIKQNEEKINHHGKRADGIVKGMLQHSRTSGGEKQLTNINALADEFLRLSYHGLRAKDKGFNAEMVTHFDENLPKINVIPQDMGRVMLNLFNNAFYAVNQKKKTAGADYKPTVEVSTAPQLPEGGVIKGIVISVRDNGTGMPDAIKDKIMQPFFTTKPTGEGTGLGLSLSYDMVVKGHGGSIDVTSADGIGSEFIIKLPLI